MSKTTKTTAETATENATEWAKDASGKLREAASKVTDDLKAASNIAIEGEAQHGSRLAQLAGDLLNARATATQSVLKAADLKEVFEIEQNYARETLATVNAGLRELGEIRGTALRDGAQAYSEGAKEIFGNLSPKKAD
jgi:uncharacterized protein YjbJ (UPF0337 family)